MLPDLRLSIKELLEQIQANRELDRHWHSKERENQRLIKATRRADRDRKRLEQGSYYHSELDIASGQIEDSETESDQSSDSYYDSEGGSSREGQDDVEMDHSDLDIDGLHSGDGASKTQLKPTSALAEVRGG